MDQELKESGVVKEKMDPLVKPEDDKNKNYRTIGTTGIIGMGKRKK